MNFFLRFHTSYALIITWLMVCSNGDMVFGQTRPSSEEVNIERKLIDGKKYTMLGEWDKAEALYRAVLSEDVQNSVACYELSRTLSASGKGQ
jgi:hypothetical protein